MRLTLFAIIGLLCLAYSYAASELTPAVEEGAADAAVGLLDVDALGQGDENEGGAREVRQWGGGWGGRGGWGGGWGGRGGWGGGWGGRGGWGGGWGGRGRWGGGWGR